MNSNSKFKHTIMSVLKITGVLLKVIYTGPLGIILLIASGYMAYEQVQQLSRFIEYRVFPTAYIIGNFCLVMFAFGSAVLFMRITFNKKLAKIRYKTVFIIMAVSMLTAAVCGITDDEYTSDFKYCSYPP